jgi:hypothetical protein
MVEHHSLLGAAMVFRKRSLGRVAQFPCAGSEWGSHLGVPFLSTPSYLILSRCDIGSHGVGTSKVDLAGMALMRSRTVLTDLGVLVGRGSIHRTVPGDL